MRPCKPLNGLQQADLSFEKTSYFSLLLLSSKNLVCETTSGKLSYVMSRTFEPKSLISVDFRGQLRITSHLFIWTTFCRVFEFEFDSRCWWQPSWSEMEILNLHDCWDRNESVPILVHGLAWSGYAFVTIHQKSVGQKKTAIFLSGTSMKVQQWSFVKSCLLLNASERVWTPIFSKYSNLLAINHFKIYMVSCLRKKKRIK